MRRRQAALRGVTRLHTPTVAEPFIVVVVDELASLTAYVTDRDAKRRINAALSLLLSQGRAVGVSVVGAVQDPRMDDAGCKRVPDLPWIEDPENVTVQQEACMTVVCLGCPVVAECRAYVGRREVTGGFWAGLHMTPDGPLIPFTGPGSPPRRASCWT